jgi:hypothetical protein
MQADFLNLYEVVGLWRYFCVRNAAWGCISCVAVRLFTYKQDRKRKYKNTVARSGNVCTSSIILTDFTISLEDCAVWRFNVAGDS